METLCGAIGSFWELESERFKAQGESMIADEFIYSEIRIMMASVAAQDLEIWKRSKEDLLTYAVDMANNTGGSHISYLCLVIST